MPGSFTAAAAHRVRNAKALGGVAREIDGGTAIVGGRRDVEEHDLVGALPVVLARELDGVAGVAQIDEVDALDHAAVLDVEARDHSFGKHWGLLLLGLDSAVSAGFLPDWFGAANQNLVAARASSSVKLPS